MTYKSKKKIIKEIGRQNDSVLADIVANGDSNGQIMHMALYKKAIEYADAYVKLGHKNVSVEKVYQGFLNDEKAEREQENLLH